MSSYEISSETIHMGPDAANWKWPESQEGLNEAETSAVLGVVQSLFGPLGSEAHRPGTVGLADPNKVVGGVQALTPKVTVIGVSSLPRQRSSAETLLGPREPSTQAAHEEWPPLVEGCSRIESKNATNIEKGKPNTHSLARRFGAFALVAFLVWGITSEKHSGQDARVNRAEVTRLQDGTIGVKGIGQRVYDSSAGAEQKNDSYESLEEFAAHSTTDVSQVYDALVKAYGIDDSDTSKDTATTYALSAKTHALQRRLDESRLNNEERARLKVLLAYVQVLSVYPDVVKKMPDTDQALLEVHTGLDGTANSAAKIAKTKSALDTLIAETSSTASNYDDRSVSLLAAGITRIEGSFVKAAPVSSTGLQNTNKAPKKAGAEKNTETLYYWPTAEDLKVIAPGVSKERLQEALSYIMPALHEEGLDTDPMLVSYIMATVAIETGSFKADQHEIGVGPEKPYWPYIGRGYSQLTWKNNYAKYGRKIGKDLINEPNLLNDPKISARVLALFHRDNLQHTLSSLRSGSLAEARKRYNGGTNGMSHLERNYTKLHARLKDQGVAKETPLRRLALSQTSDVIGKWGTPHVPEDCEAVDAEGYSPGLRRLADALEAEFGDLDLGGVIRPKDKKYGHGEKSDHYNGHAFDIMLDPRKDIKNFDKQVEITNWITARAAEYGVHYVIVNNQIWNSKTEYRDKGWRDYGRAVGRFTSNREYILAHMEHIHVSMYVKDLPSAQRQVYSYDSCESQQN